MLYQLSYAREACILANSRTGPRAPEDDNRHNPAFTHLPPAPHPRRDVRSRDVRSPNRRTAWLGAFVVAIDLVFGIAELVSHLDDPASLVFWMPTLFGGAVLVFLGVFRRVGPSAVALVIVGVGAASLATAWTLIVPLLGIVLVVLVARQPQAASRDCR